MMSAIAEAQSVGLVAMVLASACSRQQAAPAASTPAAKVANPTTEAALATVTLTPEAEKRLAITVAPVERRAVPNGRLVAGEVIVPPGGAIDVTAPVAGTLAGTPLTRRPRRASGRGAVADHSACRPARQMCGSTPSVTSPRLARRSRRRSAGPSAQSCC